MRAQTLFRLTLLVLALSSWPTLAAAQGTIDTLPYGTFWNGSVETFDDLGSASCCASYSATTDSPVASHSLSGAGATYDSNDGLYDDFATVMLDGSASLWGSIDVSGNAFALADNNSGSGTVSLGWFDTVHVVSSALAPGTPVDFEQILSLNLSNGLFGGFSGASQQVQVSWTPLDDEPDIQPFSINIDCSNVRCDENLTQGSPVSLVTGASYKVLVTVQVFFDAVPYANLEDGAGSVSVSSLFTLASLSSDASYTTASGLGEPPDTDGPTITITSPTNTTYALNDAVQAEYKCTDPDDTVVTCAGTLPDGQKIDTASVGSKAFTVSATDGRGNSSTQSVNYDVAYSVCPLYDTAKSKKSGSTVPIKLQICDANGTDVSDPGVVLRAIGVLSVPSNTSQPLQSAGKSNSSNNFRFDSKLGPSGGYIFNLKTSSYASGVYTLQFTAGNDPTVHSVTFGVK